MKAIFIYSSKKKVKVLNAEQAKKDHNWLIELGYKHKATVDASIYLEFLLNLNDKNILKEIKDVKL